MDEFNKMYNNLKAGDVFPTLLMWVVVFGAMWLFMFRPQQKRQKKDEEMRNNLKIGDEVITIGGVVGKIINMRDDNIVVESGSEKLCFKKWAVASVNESS